MWFNDRIGLCNIKIRTQKGHNMEKESPGKPVALRYAGQGG